jgi:hypothetical protein
VQLADGGATLAGIRNAMARLEAAVAGGDRVFFYYSGHGGTQRVDNACQSTLITHDDQDLLSSELYTQLERIKAKGPRQMFVMFDACHSGEITDRASRPKSSPGNLRQRVKARIQGKDGEPQCNAPVNVLETRLDNPPKAAAAAKGTLNPLLSGHLVMLSAARANEYAWDTEEGGEATNAALHCLRTQRMDSTEGNGFISAQALAQCAQARIDSLQPVGQRQHVVAHGQVTAPLAPRWAPLAQSATSAAGSLEAFVQLSDPTWRLQVEPYVGTAWRASDPAPFNWANTAQRIQIGGADRFQITVQSPRPGYLYLVNASRDRNMFSLKYPLAADLQAGALPYLQANVPLTVPRRWGAAGNNGQPEQNTLFAIVAERRMPDLEALLLRGPQAATGALSQQLAQAAVPCTPAAAAQGACTRSPRKTLDDGEAADAGPVRYGAARVQLDEF